MSPLGSMKRAAWSYIQALKASRRLGRASRLSKAGRLEEALAVAREGLALLGQSDVLRQSPLEASALMCLTITVEQHAPDLKHTGTDERDLRDAYAALAELRASGKSSLRNLRAFWLPYLHQRLGLEGDPPP